MHRLWRGVLGDESPSTSTRPKPGIPQGARALRLCSRRVRRSARWATPWSPRATWTWWPWLQLVCQRRPRWHGLHAGSCTQTVLFHRPGGVQLDGDAAGRRGAQGARWRPALCQRHAQRFCFCPPNMTPTASSAPTGPRPCAPCGRGHAAVALPADAAREGCGLRAGRGPCPYAEQRDHYGLPCPMAHSGGNCWPSWASHQPASHRAGQPRAQDGARHPGPAGAAHNALRSATNHPGARARRPGDTAQTTRPWRKSALLKGRTAAEKQRPPPPLRARWRLRRPRSAAAAVAHAVFEELGTKTPAALLRVSSPRPTGAVCWIGGQLHEHGPSPGPFCARFWPATRQPGPWPSA